ncbi:MAG TPA: DoxX family protein [Vicinamibacterales bacterium]|nr:DoxX family protein [Vicinamibacterales bacterium]
MNVLLWVLQVLLAVAFLAHGLMMIVPPPEIAAQMNAALPRWFSLFIGVSEVFAAIGLTLPGVTRVMPGLVTWAAVGIMFVMISATGYHIVRNELSSAAVTFLLLLIATYVAYMRWRVYPIGARKTFA